MKYNLEIKWRISHIYLSRVSSSTTTNQENSSFTATLFNIVNSLVQCPVYIDWVVSCTIDSYIEESLHNVIEDYYELYTCNVHYYK